MRLTSAPDTAPQPGSWPACRDSASPCSRSSQPALLPGMGSAASGMRSPWEQGSRSPAASTTCSEGRSKPYQRAPSSPVTSWRTSGGVQTGPGASPPRSISTRPTSRATGLPRRTAARVRDRGHGDRTVQRNRLRKRPFDSRPHGLSPTSHSPGGSSRCSPRRRLLMTSRNVRPVQLAGARHTSEVPNSEKILTRISGVPG
jgi:hypothetical protein